MPSPRRATTSRRPAAKKPAAKPKAKPKPKPAATKKAPARPTRPKPPAAKPPPPKAKPAPKPAAVPKEPLPELEVPLPGGRRHVLSLSFVRDGDEFLARLETDGGHITELKNRSLDQLLTLVAGELEDLLA
jgi:hypothetical protein